MRDKTKPRSANSYRIGIDVGGTNTDAVLMSGRNVVAAVKRPTSGDIAAGITDALASLLKAYDGKVDAVEAVMVGTTQFINAFLQRKHLSEVAAIRVSLPKTDGVPPYVGWPEDLMAAIGDHTYMVHGGSYYTGKEYTKLDEDELRAAASDIKKKGLKAAAITSNFAPIRPDIEQRVAEILHDVYPECQVTLSSEIGGLGLIDRENAAIINASLTDFAKYVVAAMQRALLNSKIEAPLFISQNDGTLLDTATAEKYPVFTCSAGPTNSIRGAAFLTGASDAIVVDIGGTTTDIGFLKDGFPRETALATSVGGVRTNFRMPDVLSIALGGGSIVREEEGRVTIGPDSVAHELTDKALVFGGNILTTTDVAVADGHIDLGDKALLKNVSKTTIVRTLDGIHAVIGDAIDQMKTSAKKIPVILVGGGSILISRAIPGVSEVSTPEHAGVANAVGAAIAQVSGRVDRIYDFAELGREETLEVAKQDAISRAIENGADPESIRIADVIELPMTHMQTSAVQVKIRAVGDLNLQA
jgi:N-methylhydantoinase A/oxoprolinase/acetone carboxylase beta subunit